MRQTKNWYPSPILVSSHSFSFFWCSFTKKHEGVVRDYQILVHLIKFNKVIYFFNSKLVDVTNTISTHKYLFYIKKLIFSSKILEILMA